MRYKLLFASIVTTLAASLGFTAAQAAEVIDRVIAVVNDDVILSSELDTEIRITATQIAQRGISVPSDDVLRSQVLERMIITKVQTQKAKEEGIRVDDRELNEVLGNIAAQNNMNLAQFAAQTREQGIDFLSVREEIHDEILVQRLRQKDVDSRVAITDNDVDLFLSNRQLTDDIEYRLSHILIAVPDGANQSARDKLRQKATDIDRRAKAGEDFAQLAIANSDGQQALKGGDLDWRKGSNLPTLFAAVAPKLRVDQVSDVIEGPNGFNIIKLVGQRASDQDRQVVTETHAEHILLTPNTIRDEDATRAQARELYERLQKGADFQALAKQYSDDPGSRNAGGDLGWMAPGKFVPEFQVRMDQLKPGETSEPFHSQFGWHITRVLERRTRDATQDAIRNKARESIFERKEAEEYDSWSRRLRAEAYVEYRLAGDSAAPATPASGS